MSTVSAQEAVSVVKPGDRVFVHSVAAAPRVLLEAMTARSAELRVVEIVSLHTEGPAPYAAPEMARHFRVNSLFVGQNVRQAVHEGRADYLPVDAGDDLRVSRRDVVDTDVRVEEKGHGSAELGTRFDGRRVGWIREVRG